VSAVLYKYLKSTVTVNVLPGVELSPSHRFCVNDKPHISVRKVSVLAKAVLP
jgi:hypothetical protein